MRVVYSARVEVELEGYLAAGIDRFGRRVAEITFNRIDRSLKTTLARQPYLGRFMPERRVYRYVILRTPFVAYYHVGVGAHEITILAVFHGAQDRAEFEPD